MIRIALDAMGSDNAPQVEVEGAAQALKELPAEFQIQLVGRKADIEAALSRVRDRHRGRGTVPPRYRLCAPPAVSGTRRAVLSAPAPRPPLRPEGRCHFPSRPTRCGSSVLDGHSLFAVVIPARRTNAMGLLHVTTARARLQRGDDGFIVCAARALLALRRSALGYGHFRFVLRLRAEFVLEHLQRLPAGIGRGRAIAGAGVEILATLWA